jgi:hypothetical protein
MARSYCIGFGSGIINMDAAPTGLYQLWLEPNEKFFERVDENGGWPVKAKWAGIEHTVERYRPVTFTEKEIRTEWYTSFVSADEYYWWKISNAFKKEQTNKVIRKIGQSLITST